MSSIGSGPLGIPPLVTSAAGSAAQQKAADANRTARDGEVQKFQLDRADQFEKSVGDIGESDETDDRDADGRMPWTFRRPTPPSGEESSLSQEPRHAVDPNQERGGQLDLDA